MIIFGNITKFQKATNSRRLPLESLNTYKVNNAIFVDPFRCGNTCLLRQGQYSHEIQCSKISMKEAGKALRRHRNNPGY